MKTIFVFGFVLLAGLATIVAAFPALGDQVVVESDEDGLQDTVAFEETVAGEFQRFCPKGVF